MSLEIVAARDINHAFDIVSIKPMENGYVVQPDKIGDFLYNFRESFRNYECYYQFDPYRETYLEIDKVFTIKHFSNSVIIWLEEDGTEENSVIEQYGLSFKKIRNFAITLGSVCDTAIKNGYGLVGLGD